MAIDKSGKQFLNFKNGRNKRKHDHYQLDGFEDKIFFSSDQLKHGVLEKKEVTSRYFGTVVVKMKLE